jgi:hypothetical protein
MLWPLYTFSQDSGVSLKVSKDDIIKSLEMMKKEGKLSDADYIKTKKELGNMDQSQIDSLNDKAVNFVKKNPEKADDMYKSLHLHNDNKINYENLGKELENTSK